MLFLSVDNSFKKSLSNIILNNGKATYVMKDGIICFKKSNLKSSSRSCELYVTTFSVYWLIMQMLDMFSH